MLLQKILAVSMSFLLDLTVLLGETLAMNCSSLSPSRDYCCHLLFFIRYCPIGGAIFMNNPKITSINLGRLE